MRPGRVRADVTEAEIERDEHPALGAARCPNVRIRPADEVLIANGVHVVPRSNEDGNRLARDVLVELDPHEPAGSTCTSCLANQAPYATAARIPSPVNVG